MQPATRIRAGGYSDIAVGSQVIVFNTVLGGGQSSASSTAALAQINILDGTGGNALDPRFPLTKVNGTVTLERPLALPVAGSVPTGTIVEPFSGQVKVKIIPYPSDGAGNPVVFTTGTNTIAVGTLESNFDVEADGRTDLPDKILGTIPGVGKTAKVNLTWNFAPSSVHDRIAIVLPTLFMDPYTLGPSQSSYTFISDMQVFADPADYGPPGSIWREPY